MGAKTLSVLGHHEISAENAGKIIDELGLPNDYSDEEVASALEWVITTVLGPSVPGHFNYVHDLPSLLRILKILLVVAAEDQAFVLEAFKLKPLPGIESPGAENAKELILLILENQRAIELIRDSQPEE